jgi:hypothetical protein
MPQHMQHSATGNLQPFQSEATMPNTLLAEYLRLIDKALAYPAAGKCPSQKQDSTQMPSHTPLTTRRRRCRPVAASTAAAAAISCPTARCCSSPSSSSSHHTQLSLCCTALLPLLPPPPLPLPTPLPLALLELGAAPLPLPLLLLPAPATDTAAAAAVPVGMLASHTLLLIALPPSAPNTSSTGCSQAFTSSVQLRTLLTCTPS